MIEDVKVVAKTKKGEILKGFVDRIDLENFNTHGSAYMRLVNPGNTVGTYLCQDQLEGLFLVNTFEGNKPLLPLRLYRDLKRILKDNLSLVSAAAVVASLSMIGLVALL